MKQKDLRVFPVREEILQMLDEVPEGALAFLVVVTGEIKKKQSQNHEGEYRLDIQEELTEMGFPSSMQGSRYLEEGIFFILTAQKCHLSTTKDIYPEIADKYGTNAGNVERSIRVVIEKVWTEQSLEKLEQLYGGAWSRKTGRPTNTSLMKKIAGKVRDKEQWE